MQNSQKDTSEQKLNVKPTDLSKSIYSDLSIGFKLVVYENSIQNSN